MSAEGIAAGRAGARTAAPAQRKPVYKYAGSADIVFIIPQLFTAWQQFAQKYEKNIF